MSLAVRASEGTLAFLVDLDLLAIVVNLEKKAFLVTRVQEVLLVSMGLLVLQAYRD